MDIQIGRVTQYYDEIGVAVIEVLTQPLRVGDVVKISGFDYDFTQTIESLQVEHLQVEQLLPEETGSIRVSRPVRAGDMLYLLTHT